MKKNLIIDGGNLLHRTYHAAKSTQIYNSSGRNLSHVVTYLQSLKNLKNQFKPDRVFIAWDIRDDGFVNFRQEQTDYKTHRDRSEREDLHQYDKLIWSLTRLLGVCNIRANKLEGDDIVFFLVKTFWEDDNTVVSQDNDFLQLFKIFPDVKVYNTLKNKVINESNASEFNGGIDNGKFLQYKAVMGDSSDNIKGLYKYGPVKSKKFVENFKENFDKLGKDDQDTITRNLKLMSLKYGLKYYEDEEEYYQSQLKEYDIRLNDFFDAIEKLELGDNIRKSSDWMEAFGENLRDALQNLSKLINN